MLFGEWLDKWLELYVFPSRLADSTKACYNRAVRAVPPFLRVVPLSDLNALQLREWLLSVAAVTPRAAQLDRVMLSRALSIAAKLGFCRSGLVDRDVCPPIDHEPRKASILDSDQLHRYITTAGATAMAPLLLLCCCGLRRGEAMGARWENIDLKNHTFAVVGQRQSGSDQLRPLKSKASRRVILMPAVLVELLRSWPRNINGWVCDCTQQQLYAAHRLALRRAGLHDVTLHGLRHSFATAAVIDGQPVKLVQGALGHAHYSVTADLYADHLPPISGVANAIFAHDWKSCVR